MRPLIPIHAPTPELAPQGRPDIELDWETAQSNSPVCTTLRIGAGRSILTNLDVSFLARGI